MGTYPSDAEWESCIGSALDAESPWQTAFENHLTIQRLDAVHLPPRTCMGPHTATFQTLNDVIVQSILDNLR